MYVRMYACAHVCVNLNIKQHQSSATSFDFVFIYYIGI